MKQANYLVFGELWHLLERLQLIDGIDFGEFALDDPADVSAIIERWIRPYFEAASESNKSLIQSSFVYYLTTRTAPFEELRDDAQDLMLFSDGAEVSFLEAVGRALFGKTYLDDVRIENYVELLDERAARMVFSP